MNNRISIILLAALILLGVLLIYSELRAAPLPCWAAEYQCTYVCHGEFSYDYCWESPLDGLVYCYFWCVGFGWPEPPCTWYDPTHAICLLGPPK